MDGVPQAQNCEETASRVVGVPFQAGFDERRNLGGRPKRKWLTDVWDEMLEEKLSNPDDRAAYKESTWRKMLAGNVVSAMTTDRVVERTEGKLPTNVDVTGNISVTLSDRMARAEERLKDGE